MNKAQTLSSPYSVELANGKEVRITKTVKGCTINLVGNVLLIARMPMQLGGFNVATEMD
jgi:hypothetical protein